MTKFLTLCLTLGLLTACNHIPPISDAALDKLASQLRADVVHLVAKYPQRSHANPTQLAQMARELQEKIPHAQLQAYEVEGETYYNVVARFEPQDAAAKKQSILVIGAHYDTAAGLPGADDNTSGVAALLALAQKLSTASLSRPVELVAYSLEEPPYFRTQHMGSAVHAKALAAAQTPVAAMLSLECIGYFSDAPQSQTYPISVLEWLYPSTGNFIAVIGSLSDILTVRKVKNNLQNSDLIPVESLAAPASIEGVDFSDHLNYQALGIPAVMITDTAFFRNARYHTEQDTPETLDYPRMARVVEAVYGLVMNW